MNLSQAIIAKSDQLNADDLISGPRTFTIKEVRRGDADQPVAIVLAEFPDKRPFKPSKTVLRLFAYAWGEETDEWPKNPRVTLYRDASVKWAGQEIGGIRVSHMSHIDWLHKGATELKVALSESKGKKSLWRVEGLPADAPTTPPKSEAAVLLDEIGAAADAAGVSRQQVAEEWAASHDGQHIGEATDVGGLELLRDDLRARTGADQ